MARLYRPTIPVEVKCQVALRQLGELWIDDAVKAHAGALGAFLARLLSKLAELLDCKVNELQLDHNPALENRPFNSVTRRYIPDANDDQFLIYREKHAHRIKTLVRGDGAQLSDAAIARKRKRKERKASRRFRFPVNKSKQKMKSRPLQSANRWPPKGSHKIGRNR